MTVTATVIEQDVVLPTNGGHRPRWDYSRGSNDHAFLVPLRTKLSQRQPAERRTHEEEMRPARVRAVLVVVSWVLLAGNLPQGLYGGLYEME